MRNEQYEQRLDELGVPYEYVGSIELEEISGSIQSRLRTDDTIPEEVRRHEVNARELGTSRYPPLVVSRNGGGGWVLLDGHQRKAGFDEAGVKSHDAYVVQSDESRVRRIAAQGINAVHGLPPSEEERLERAKEMVREGETQAQAAKTWHVSESVLSTDLRSDRVDAKAVKAGMSPRMLEGIPKTTKVYAHKIKRPHLLRATLETIARCGMNGATAKGAIDRVLAASSDNEAMEYLDKQTTPKSQGRSTAGPASSVLAAISRLTTAIRKHPAHDLPSEDRERVSVACEDAVELLIDYTGDIKQ